MNRTILLFVLAVTFSIASFGQTKWKAIDIYKRAAKAMDTISQVSYRLQKTELDIFNGDTIRRECKVAILFGAERSPYISYFLEEMIVVPEQKRFLTQSYFIPGLWIVGNNIANDTNTFYRTWNSIPDYGFIGNQNWFGPKNEFKEMNGLLMKLFVQSSSVTLETVNKTVCFRVDLKVKPNKERADVTNSIWLDTATYLPQRFLQQGTEINGMPVYTSVFLSNIQTQQNAQTQFLTTFRPDTSLMQQLVFQKKETSKSNYKVGDDVSNLILYKNNDSVLKVSDLKGKVILLDFWYNTCFPCLAMMPDMQALHKEYSSDDFVLIGINERNQPDVAQKVIEKFSITYTNYYGKEAGLESILSINTHPTKIIIDKKGKLVYWDAGYSKNKTKRELSNLINRYL